MATGAWTVGHRWVVLAMLTAVAAFLLFERFHEPVIITDPPASSAPRAAEVADKLDPNTATAADLSTIPELGEKRAAEIIAYREEIRRQRPGAVVFRESKDLLVIKGIGVGTVRNMEPYLTFPARRP